jgi:hypothetical protein
MKLTKERIFILSGQGGLLLVFVGIVLARWVAPPRPSETPTQIARMFQTHTDAIRLGIVLALFGAALLGPFVAMLSMHLQRIDGASPASAYCQMTLGGLLILELIIPIMVLAAAAFRPNRPAAEIQLLDDLGWLMAVAVVSTAVVELLVIGAAIMQDRHPDPVFPRWSGVLNLVCAILLIPGALSIYFTGGPFSWDGALAYWLPLVVFGLWIGSMTYLLLEAERKREAETDPSGGANADIATLQAEVAALRTEFSSLNLR